MNTFLFIVGTPFFFGILYVIRLIWNLKYSAEYQTDIILTPDFVSNLSRIIVIYMMGYLPGVLIIVIFGNILQYIIPFTVYRILFILAGIITSAMGIIKYRKNSKRYNSFSEKKKWILCCLAFGFVIGRLETQLAAPCSTVETIIGYASCIAWSIIISGGFREIPILLIDLIDKLFDKK